MTTTPVKDDSTVATIDFEHIDLYKYFESRGTEVKNTMLSVVTWVLGFAAVVFGFVVTQCLVLQSDTLVVKQPLTMILLSAIGLGIAWYADFLIRDFGGHINRNFDRADRARAGLKSFDEIWGSSTDDSSESTTLPLLCNNIRTVAWVFGGVFLLAIVFGLYTLLFRQPM